MAKLTWQQSVNACIAAACLHAAGGAIAADADPFAVPKGAPGESDLDARAGQAEDGSAIPAAAIDRSRERQLLDAAQRSAAVVAEDAAGAFRRGLMPLRHYLQQTSLVTQIDVMAADVRAVSPVAALQQQGDRLRDARDRLVRFRQPAAEGWAADVALAEWALASAEFNLAFVREDVVGERVAAAFRRQWATEHLHRRAWDADIGAASLPDMAHAASIVVAGSAGGEREARTAEYRLLLQRIRERTAEWSAQGAGIGRADRLLRSSFAVNHERMVSIRSDGAQSIDPAAFRSADADLQDLFATQLEFHRHGTADLYDLAETWLTWRDLHTEAATAPGMVGRQQAAPREAALATLQDLAERVTDRRGRNAADVGFVQLLVQLDAVDAARSASGVTRGYLH